MVRLYRSYSEVLQGRKVTRLIDAGLAPEEISAELSVFQQGDVLVTEMTTLTGSP